jgi:hypothetical protein
MGGCVGTAVSAQALNAYATQKRIIFFITYLSFPLLLSFSIFLKILAFRMWTSMCTATDTAIALAFLWELSWIKTPFKATQRCFSLPLLMVVLGLMILVSLSLIHRLMASTIHTGAATSLFGIVKLILFLVDKKSTGGSIQQCLELFEGG